MSNRAFLTFSLGPVQTFIEAARTVRDLWTGSYLLSWLTLQAMTPVVEKFGPAALVFPDVTEHPLVRWKMSGRKPEGRQLLQPCLPNRFLAEVPAAEADALAKECRDAGHNAWDRVAGAVRHQLAMPPLADSTFSDEPESLWWRQVRSFFEMRTAVLPWSECGPELLNKLLGEEVSAGEGDLWVTRWEVVGKLLQALRAVRHFPDYRPPEGERVAQKCSLLGTYEHLGPAERDEARNFWEQAAEQWRSRGTRTGPRERLCAVSLVKRFAWPHFFSTPDELGLPTRDLRFEDTATVAAALWLADDSKGAPKLDPDVVRRELSERNERKSWSGQWLHWSAPDQDPDDDAVPTEPVQSGGPSTWQVILKKRRLQGWPPIYYAILMLDADRMGDHLRAAGGRLGHQKISAALARFALRAAPEIVERHAGELVYAGGDDVLALLPTANALACATALNDAFRTAWPHQLSSELPVSVSCGLAVVHYKEDLRFALRAARQAEKQAKQAGRDTLQIDVARRSGEHSSVPCPWPMVGRLTQWVAAFARGASDRWAYHLKGELEVLRGLEVKAVKGEIVRQVRRAEEVTRSAFPEADLMAAFEEYSRFRLELFRRPKDEAFLRQFPTAEVQEWELRGRAVEGFVALCQTASFLARGRDT